MSLLSAAGRTRFVLAMSTIAVVSLPFRAQAQETKPFAALSNSATSLRDSVVRMARAQIGRRYRTGGESPDKGFDCSGLIQYVMTALNVKLPRTAKQQALQGKAIGKDTTWLMPGDLLTFGKGQKGVVSHIGIYVGNGRYVHASSVAGKVIESPIDRPFSPLIKVWRGVRRVLGSDDSTAAVLATVALPENLPKEK
jgi:cell wall-associated NlpC family hydrolase